MVDAYFYSSGYDPIATFTRRHGRPPPGMARPTPRPEPPREVKAEAGDPPRAGLGEADHGAAGDVVEEGGGVPAEPANSHAADERPATTEAAPRRSPSPSEVGEDLAQDAASLDHPSDGPSPGAGEEREPEPHELVVAWMNKHWATVSAMAQAGEAPVRPVPPRDGEVADRRADGGGSPPGTAFAANPLHHPADGPPPRPGEDIPPPYVAPGDRWTKPKMAEFLRQLAATQSVTAAAKAVGMSRNSAYKLRNRLKGQPFDIAWEAAFRHGYDNLAHSALELALEGEEVPHYHKGELVGTHRKRNPALIVQLLRMRNREGAPMLGRYGAAAEFWSESWDRMIRRVETGSASWSDEHAALSPEERAALPEASQEISRFIARNAPDEGPKGRSRA